jgi:hypothetical protein
MTTLTTAQIPTNINTLEKLHLWSGLTLRAINGSKAVVENEGFLPERLVQVPFIESPNDGVRSVVRVNIQLDPAYASDKTKKLWEFANELTGGSMPPAYTSN